MDFRAHEVRSAKERTFVKSSNADVCLGREKEDVPHVE
jgi:hypothetical protein